MPTDTEPPQVSPSSPCSVADDATITALGESDVAGAEEGSVFGVSNCRYELTEGGTVQIISVPATLWAQQIPEALQQIAGSPIADAPLTAAKVDAALEMVADGQTNTDEGACALFSLMVELQGLAPGQTEVVNFVPSGARPLAVNGQRCTDGAYTSVQLETEGIVDDAETYARVTEALDAVHTAGF
ncbi:MAG: hypothetical protein R8J94_05360 [Acidimicrobiia bacterium]|nr:hypothetical protein [Acidimicrobiia bacterium]